MKTVRPIGGVIFSVLLTATGCEPWAHSDVDVTDKIGPYCHQDDLTITDFKAEAVTVGGLGSFLGPLYLLVRIHIIGTLSDDHGLPPYISKVQLAEFFESPTAGSDEQIADIIVTPVVDEHWLFQKGPFNRHIGPVPFDVKIEKVVESYRWGPNVFRFKCGELQKDVSLQHSK